MIIGIDNAYALNNKVSFFFFLLKDINLQKGILTKRMQFVPELRKPHVIFHLQGHIVSPD